MNKSFLQFNDNTIQIKPHKTYPKYKQYNRQPHPIIFPSLPNIHSPPNIKNLNTRHQKQNKNPKNPTSKIQHNLYLMLQ